MGEIFSMKVKEYTATTSESRTQFLNTKYVLIETSKNNSDEVQIAFSYNPNGTRETDYITLGINEKRFFGAPEGKKITYVWMKSESGSQTITITARDATITIPTSKVDVEQAYPYWDVTPDTPFVERWEFLNDLTNRRKVFFEKYQGRIGAVWKSEAHLPESAWSLPNVLLDQTIDGNPSPWNNVIDMTNSKDGSTVDEIYFAIRRCYKRARMRLTAKLPDPTTVPSGTYFYFGFEVVSQGGTMITCVELVQNHVYLTWNYIAEDGTLMEKSEDITSLLTFGSWQTYIFEFDPPVIRLSKMTYPTYTLIKEAFCPSQSASDMLIPFFANESTSIVSGYYINHIAVTPITHCGNAFKNQTFTNPTSNPTLTLDVGSRSYIEVYAKSIAGSKTVNVYGSVDRTNWRKCDTLTTDATTLEAHKGYNNAYRFIKLELVETGTGTSTLEITASRGVG
jgi:hypothetical protein